MVNIVFVIHKVNYNGIAFFSTILCYPSLPILNIGTISMPTDDVEKRAVLFQKLIEIGTLFSDGKDWSPSEIVRHYRDKGLIRGDYLRIAWRNKQDFNITTE